MSAPNCVKKVTTIVECGSGRELFAKGLEQDVHDCLRVDAYGCQPLLRDGGYAQMEFLAPSEA